MTKGICVYEFGRVRHILDYLRELQDIAHTYHSAEDRHSRARALKAWEDAMERKDAPCPRKRVGRRIVVQRPLARGTAA